MSLLNNIKNNKIIGVGSLYVFIDSSNLWAAQKSKQRLLDYEKILNYIKNNFKPKILKVFYYTAYPARGTRSYSLDNKHNFFTFLKKGFSGDSDFLSLINHLRKNSKKVYILSSRNNISEELRTAGDGYCDVLDIEDIWGNNLVGRDDKKNHPSQKG